MKYLNHLCLIALISLFSTTVLAQKQKGKATITIKTSTECNMCKARVEKGMAYTKGVISSNLDVEKAELTVNYKTHKTSPDKIRKAISDMGYDADTIKANKKAHDALPDCCQKGGMDGH